MTYEELWRTLKKKGSRLPEDHYRDRLENFRKIKKLFLDEIQIARQDWEFLVQKAKSAGQGLTGGEMKKIPLSKLTPGTEQKIRDGQGEKKVLGQWVEVRGLPEMMTEMEVRDVLNSVTADGMKDTILREGRWRVEINDSEGSEFFTKLVEGSVKFKGTVVRVLPWILSYSIDQVWDQLEKYANLEKQNAKNTKGFGTKVSAVSDKGCAVCLSMGKDQRAAAHFTADHRLHPSDLKTIQSKVEGKGGQQRNLERDGVQNLDQHQ